MFQFVVTEEYERFFNIKSVSRVLRSGIRGAESDNTLYESESHRVTAAGGVRLPWRDLERRRGQTGLCAGARAASTDTSESI